MALYTLNRLVWWFGVSELVGLVDKVLSNSISEIESILGLKDSVREEVIKITREIIRLCGEAVRYIHTSNYKEAFERIIKARENVEKVKDLLKEHPDLYYSGLVYNAFSEYVEAVTVYKLVVEKTMPSFRELSIPYVPYLQGLGDAIGEIRRHVLGLLDKGDIENATTYLDIMETIYSWLRRLNYPEALIPGIRHRVDVARRLLEDTRALLIYTKNALELAKVIKRHKNNVS